MRGKQFTTALQQVISMKKVILFVHNSVGGAERMTVLIGRMLSSNGFEVSFYVVNQGHPTSNITDFIPKVFNVVSIPESNPIKLIKRIYSILKVVKPNYVFSSALLINDKILPLRWLFPKIKFIIRCENYLYTFSTKQKVVIALLYRLADNIIAQTQEMKDELVEESKIKASKIVVLENPIDTKRIIDGTKDGVNPYQEIDKKIIVASGRICYQKGFDLLVEAFSLLCKEREDVLLFILGDDSNKEEFKKVSDIALKYGILVKISFMGFKTNPYPYIKYADCFALSSRWEGLPNVLIESLYLGTPVAAMACIPIIRRIISEGVDGFTADKEDVEGFAAAINNTLELGRVTSSYKGSTPEDFVNLFN